MKIVILGGTGQIGTMVTQHLIAAYANDEVLACSRSAKGKNQIAFNVFQSEWSALGKVDLLINIVGVIEEKGENTFERAHVQLVKDMIAKRTSLGNPRIIHVSVCGADVNSKAEYARTKGVADELLLKEKNVVIVRPSFVLTPGTAIVQKVNMVVRLGKPTFGLLFLPKHFITPKFQPVMGEDVAETIVKLVISNEEGIVYATGAKEMTLADMIAYTKSKYKIIALPKWLVHPIFMLLTKFKNPFMNRDQYYLLASNNVADNSRMEKILGRKAMDGDAFWRREIK